MRSCAGGFARSQVLDTILGRLALTPAAILMTAIVYQHPSDLALEKLNTSLAGYLSALSGHSSTKWFFALPGGALAVKPGPDADSLIASLFDHLGKAIGIDSHSASGATYEKLPLKAVMVWSVNSERLNTKFSLVNWENRLYAFVSGDSYPSDEQTEPWTRALNHALRALRTPPTHSWQAVIGYYYDDANPGRSVTAPFTCAGLTFSPAEFDFEESIPQEGSLSAYQIAQWRPFIVCGSIESHSWYAASAALRTQLHLLCALLTIETNHLWKLRQHPHPSAFGDTLRSVNSKLYTRRSRSLPAEAKNPERSVELLNSLWETCQADSEYAGIARAYYEATKMSDHPSFSLVGYVSVIEAVGSKLFSPAMSEKHKCSECGKLKGNSSAQRFRDALSLVLPPDRVKDISERLYKWRSGTAHSGRLYARETTFGIPSMLEGTMLPDESSLYSVRGPGHAQEIARDLLLHALMTPRS